MVALHVVATSADLPTLQNTVQDGDSVLLQGRLTKNDGGGGTFNYTSSSASPANDGTVVAAPPIVGRFIRPSDGIIHTKWFGIKHDGTDPGRTNAAKMQSFLNEVASTHQQGAIDTGADAQDGIELSGATLHFNANGTATGGPIQGKILTGLDRRYSRLLNVYLHCGKVGAFGAVGDASGSLRLQNFLLQGGMFLWSTEVCTILDGVRLYPGPAAAGGSGQDYALRAYGSNQLSLRDVRVEGKLYTAGKGAWFDGTTNLTWDGGGVNGCVQGIRFGASPLPSSAADQKPKLLNLHFESNEQEAILVERGLGVDIMGCHIRGSNVGGPNPSSWDTTFPLVRIGVSTSTQNPNGVTIRNNYFVGKPPAAGVPVVGTAVSWERVQGGEFTNNTFVRFAIAATASSNADAVVHGPNYYTDTATQLLLATTPSRPNLPLNAAQQRQPQSVVSGANMLLRCATAETFAVVLDQPARRFISPSGIAVGVTYTLFVTKIVGSASITTWDAAFKFNGTTPDFAAMSVAQTAIIQFMSIDGITLLEVSRAIVG